MITASKSKLCVRLSLIAVMVAAVIFFVNSMPVNAAGPYEIMYSTNSGRTDSKLLEGEEISGDIYVWINDPSPYGISGTWWKRGPFWRAPISTVRNTTYDSFDWKDSSAKVDFGDLNNFHSGINTISVRPSNAPLDSTSWLGDDEVESSFTVPYGAPFLNESVSGMKITTVKQENSNSFWVAGTVGTGGAMNWFLQKRSSITGAPIITKSPISIDAGQDELYDMDITTSNRLVIGGSYHNLTENEMYPVVQIHDLNGTPIAPKNLDVWGGYPGAVFALVSGTWDPSSAIQGGSTWVAGYKKDAGEAYWVVGNLKSDAIATPNWIADTDGGGNPILGEAKTITKDDKYAYVGGHIKVAGKKYWRIEKRNRLSGNLEQELVFDGLHAPLPAREGEVLDIDVQSGQGTEAIWAGGYEISGAQQKTSFQKFPVNGGGSLDAGFLGGGEVGIVRDIASEGADYIYVAAEKNNQWEVNAYDRNGNPKTGVESILLSQNVGPGYDYIAEFELPLIVGSDDSGNGHISAVKYGGRNSMVSCSEVYGNNPPPGLAQRIFIDNSLHAGLYVDHGENMSDVTKKFHGIDTLTPVGRVAKDMQAGGVVVDPIPAGKYNTGMVTLDRGHAEHTEHDEQPQDHEQLVMYFMDGDPYATTPNWKKTIATEDIPNDWVWKDTRDTTGLTIPFEVKYTTVAHYVYDNNSSRPADQWDYNSNLTFSPAIWRAGGSVEPVCTVLDRYPQCNDGIDNDSPPDGLVDYAGIDLNNDGLFTLPGEFPPDPGCSSLTDDDETDVPLGTCSLGGDYVIDVNPGSDILRTRPIGTTWTIGTTTLGAGSEIPAGMYKVTLEAYDDSHPVDATQDFEQWKVVLRNNGVNVGETGVTDDLSDLDDVQQFVTDLAASPLVLPSSVNQLVPVHPFYFNDTSANSIRPVCIALESVGKPNLVEPLVNTGGGYSDGVYVSPGFNPDTGFYDEVKIKYAVRNEGGANTAIVPFQNTLYSEFRTNILPPPLTNTVFDDTNENLSPFKTSSYHEVVLNTNVPPGDFKIVITADSNNLIDEGAAYEGDNVRTIWGSTPEVPPPNGFPHIPAPDPGVKLEVTPDFVRYGDPATLNWTLEDAWYPMECNIYGPDPDPLNGVGTPIVPTAGSHSGLITTPPITSKTQFVMKCIEQISGYDAPFVNTATVETTGRIEER